MLAVLAGQNFYFFLFLNLCLQSSQQIEMNKIKLAQLGEINLTLVVSQERQKTHPKTRYSH